MSRLTGDQDSSLPGSPASTSQEGLETGASTSCNRTLKVTLLGSEWRSTKGGLSTINRELAIQLAKYSNVEVCIYLPQCSEEDHRVAAIHNVQLIEAEELRGYEPIDWLTSLPENHHPDCIIGHGLPLGRQVQVIQRQHRCKWIQVAHAAPEDLGMFKGYQDAISRGEEKHLAEIKLCELADQVVAVGPKLADEYSRYLRYCQKDQAVMKLTPSIFSEFSHVKQATEERATFCVLVFGRGDDEDFELKGYDIAAKAIAELNENFYQLMFVGAPPGKEDGVAEKLCQHGISRTQLTMRSFKENREDLANLFCEVDLAIMPSRTEGFGLAALEALSAGLPVLVSGNSGLGDALKKVPHGSNCVVNSEDPKRWAEAIRAVCNKDRDVRLKETKDIRGKYAEEYSWEEQCGRLVEKMMDITFGLLHLRLDCTFERTARPGANVAPPASIHTQADDKTGYGTEDIPTTEQLMNFIAYKCFKTVDPSKEEEKNGFVDYMERVRRVAILDYHKGSLIITLHCSSLQILEELWEDYCTGHLNQMAQQFLVTEDILEFFGLAEVKLTATLFEEEYRACREYFLRLSGATSNQEDVLVIERHMATPASEEVPSHSMGLQGGLSKAQASESARRPSSSIDDSSPNKHKMLTGDSEGTVQNKPDSSDPGSLPTFIFMKNENLMEAVKREEICSLEISHDTKASQSIAEGKGLKEAFAGVESKFNLVTRDYEKTMRYNEKDLVTVEIKRDCEMGVRIQDNKTGQYEISYCPRDQGKYSISIKVNEQHVCGSPYDLLVKAREFKPVSSFGGLGSSVGLFNYPWGVAVRDTDEIAVTDQSNHRVQIFDSSGSYLRSFGRKGNNQGEFCYPNGICFDNNGNIFVADRGNHRIQIFTRAGAYKGFFRGDGSLDDRFTCPCGLSLDANGDIIVADSGNKLIKIFTTDGQFVRKIGESGSFSFPVHCVQCDEYFIVSDTGDHCIKVFSREGKLHHKFGHRGEGDGEFDCPRCLSVTKSKHLMVCDGGNGRIQVFELSGRFVGKFGTKGNNLGELKGPASVAVLSDGRIVISESWNHRIQIFE